ncbi:hypothetical protein AJ79_06364 [Helicocarpus griseus UAMH5409]|uniref:Uncharacterized protein n=1 Tax=Helicocarpus griseus UAMH5409 TaxID=1447875 RepID=A0A2B7XD69_9EURO|nr:hypothetical protein AJ79_06364 [Helicocarpus griseus UAMH5409]
MWSLRSIPQKAQKKFVIPRQMGAYEEGSGGLEKADNGYANSRLAKADNGHYAYDGLETKPQKATHSKRFWILIVAAVAIVCIGVGVGVGVGVSLRLKNNDPSKAKSKSPTSSLATTSTSASVTLTALEVRAAIFGDGVVSAGCKGMTSQWEGYGTVKYLSLLHQFGSNGNEDMRLFLSYDGTGHYTLKAGDIKDFPNTEPVPHHEGLEKRRLPNLQHCVGRAAPDRPNHS